MRTPAVKICGITREADAVAISELGVSYLGFIFHRPSPRWVSVKQATNIARLVSPLTRCVPVFVRAEHERILSIAHRLRTDTVQLHGREDRKLTVALQKEGLKVIQAFHVDKRSNWKPLIDTVADIALVDNQATGKRGGTGETFDWSVRPPTRIMNLALSGGLTKNNVAEGMRIFQPLLLDFNSGVESAPGIKSIRKVREVLKLTEKIAMAGAGR